MQQQPVGFCSECEAWAWSNTAEKLWSSSSSESENWRSISITKEGAWGGDEGEDMAGSGTGASSPQKKKSRVESALNAQHFAQECKCVFT